MARGQDRFEAASSALGFTPVITHYPDGTRTAQDAADAIGCEVAQIVKSLVFMADHQAVLALTAGDHRVDTDALARVAGADTVRQATADEAREATGYAIGGTPPFGHPAPIPAWIDPALTEHDEVHAAGGTPSSCFAVSPAELVRLSGAEPADFTEQRPKWRS